MVIPDSVTLIRDTAFINCYSLTNIKVSEENSAYKDIEGNLYSKDGSVLIQYAIAKTATEFVIPDSVTTIGDYAIGLASNLTSVVIGDNVTSIGYYSISTCYNLTSVEIGDGVTSIGRYAFAFCSALTSIEIGDGVTSIAYDAFEDCPIETAKIPVIAIHYISNSNLKTLTITSGEIDSSEFWECDSLTSVEIGDGVTSIDSRGFRNLYRLMNIEVSEGNSAYKDIDGNLYSKDGTTLIHYAIGKTATEFIIPDGVTTIDDSAFSDCSSLTSVIIPNSVTTIGDWAFESCSSLTIYCEAESEPSGWNGSWNPSNRPVVWGYKQEN